MYDICNKCNHAPATPGMKTCVTCRQKGREAAKRHYHRVNAGITPAKRGRPVSFENARAAYMAHRSTVKADLESGQEYKECRIYLEAHEYPLSEYYYNHIIMS